PNQQIVRGTLADIAAKVRAAGIKRQAMIIVGNALKHSDAKSQLYDAAFAHGYRGATGATEAEPLPARIAIYALTAAGTMKAAEIAGGLPGTTTCFAPEHLGNVQAVPFIPAALAELLRRNWHDYEAHVLIMAAGIAVRKIAPLLDDKATDPAVVVCDERGDYAVSLVGGHLGGANRLVRRIAGITGGQPVITTATDVNHLLAFDELAARQHWRVVNPAAIKALNTALLSGNRIEVVLPPELFARYYAGLPQVRRIDTTAELSGAPAVLLNVSPPPSYPAPVLQLNPAVYHVGIGCRRGVTAAAIAAAVEHALADGNIEWGQVADLASLNAKQDEPGLLEWAREKRLKLRFFTAAELNRYPGPHPTPRAMTEFGVIGVAEPAALAAAGPDGKLYREKYKENGVTVAIAIAIGDPS
ncbi:MAG: cobalamin biosynthesis protein, partial [Victivallales bacterium]|nr:cobalamin biosynthesis protein [Victivallales bacterium]